MDLTETFVVRIYQRNRAPGKPLAGIVESIDKKTTQRFSNFEELRFILEQPRAVRRSGRQRSSNGDKCT